MYAVELFLTDNNQLFVNEISPRVHNTGNHTLETTKTSQYEQHLRAITGRALGSTARRAPVTVMRNILNVAHPLGDLASELPHEVREGSAVLHWYGKKADRPMRKLGHITAWGNTLEEAWLAVRKVENTLCTLWSIESTSEPLLAHVTASRLNERQDHRVLQLALP